ncbi:class F sortase [Streptomyces endophyticus]|uniref:Class F sortase n=1 Tax=Streptomyces endophyticus TaxID=714166 RepID=A0ABU6FD39_9ACTN|nr:class F sortase [Streptomyces endophyticus]MEB8341949.1 class F sortase [Streptomyces endophyticus]
MTSPLRTSVPLAAVPVLLGALLLPGAHPAVASSDGSARTRISSPLRAQGELAHRAADSPPVRLRIPRLRVSAPFTGLSLDAQDRLQIPSKKNRNLVGWYEDGVPPGARGNAIVLGHVDTKSGPAVFYRLGQLRSGNTVNVRRADGSTAEFRVTAVRTYKKSRFPNQLVYGATRDAQLRLITCGGEYRKSEGGYQSNVVVFAKLDGIHGGS